MANNSSNSVNLLGLSLQATDVKSTRDTASAGGVEFGAQFKNELSKAQQPKPAEKAPANKQAENKPRSEVKENTADAEETSVVREPSGSQESAATQSKPAQPAEKAANSAAGEEVAEQTATGEADLAALLAMMQVAQVAQPVAVEQKTELQTGDLLEEKNGGANLLAALAGDAKSSNLEQAQIGADDLLGKDDGSDQSKQHLLAAQLDASKKSTANIAVEGLDPLESLPQGLKAVHGKRADSFVDTLNSKLAPAAPTGDAPGAINTATSLNQLQSVKAAAAAVPSHYIDTQVHDSRWGDAVAQRVSMMLGKQEQQIEMQLNPPNLGPMEVRLNLGGEQASVIFTSQHAAVREALAAATPKLTALLADQGIVLHNVQVASDSLQQQQQQQQQQASQQQQDNRFNSSSSASRYGVEMNGVAGKGGAERVVNLSDLRLPAGSTRVSLFV
ncbi:flagellar hook-length control protein FliK [Chitinibacter sp. S2-10]|uniref:flagellar hook-length control protein FliK n=1 Tax=Chitinibacter sp. S2-10 TaxID=3373597 RepID=UPI003977C7AF